ncbi:hypothetical protein CRV02_08825 [Arcobacter sp. CECT 8989]|uniref:flagellar hook-length control protein FliK n=1 Tax=Arcobacter sp. CECT 8989 TaxID=2044509 RepID=UPI00100A311E|nr:flagellar hook-length control protein FliK [Arcobacter sp. CECT 8989]RXK00761.1 hypothetical protein CRV02_08825 [Arcobacter sp. CECT 8989]
MSEEVNFLNIGKSTQDTKTSTNNKTSEGSKKEGMSLFDSLLVKNTKKIETSSEETTKIKEKTQETTDFKKVETSNEEIKEKSSKNSDTDSQKKESLPSKSNDNKNELDIDKKKSSKENITENSDNKKDINKVETKSSSSLLDRMILEANKKVKNNSNQKVEEKTLKNADTKDLSQKQNSLFDEGLSENKLKNKTQIADELKSKEQNEPKEGKELKESKETVSKNTELESISDNKESKKSDEKPNDEKVKQTQPSLMDQLLNKAKKDLESKDKESTLNKVEEKKDTKKSISQVVNETKKDLTNKSTKEVQVEKNSSVENKDAKEVNTPKEEKVVNNIELKDTSKDEKSLKDINQTSVEKKEDKVSNNNSSNKEENKAINIKDEKIAKASLQETKEVNTSEEKANKKTDINASKVEQNTTKEEPKTNDSKVISKEEKSTNIEVPSKKTEINTSTNENKKEAGNLAKLDKEAIVQDEQKIEVKKETLKQENTDNSKDSKTKSLMDQLINTNKPKTVSTETLETNVNSSSKNGDLLTNIYLGSQKNSIYNQMLSTKSEAVRIVKEGKSAEDIKKGADKLELNPKDLSVSKEDTKVVETKQELNKQTEQKVQRDSIDRMVMDQNNKRNPLSSETTSKLNLSSSNTQETTINLTVSPNAALTIQNRIIGAQQQMSSMMSDIARNMYENYKPPITAFRINLFPAQLGQIAILMKSDRDSGISISMNMSNSATLDAVVENQGSLREAINRNFNNQTDVNFEFGMQGESQNNSSSGNNEGNQEQTNHQQHSSTDILEAVNDNKNVADDINYM